MAVQKFQDVDLENVTAALNQAVAASQSLVARYVSAAGISPASLAADIVLATVAVPAGLFGPALDQLANLYIVAQGKFGATANNKRVKLIANPTTAVVGSAIVGGTTLIDTGTLTTNAGGFILESGIIRAGVNSQVGTNYGVSAGTVGLGTTPPIALTITDSAAFVLAITGNATTATTDIVLNYFEVDGLR